MARKQTQGTKSAIDDMDGNVDKIREILFGGQMRDYEGRFADLEKRLTQRIERTGAELEKRIERLNTYAKREVDKLSERIKTERKDRVADAKGGERELKDLSQHVEGWYAELEDRLDTESKDLRKSLHEQSEDLSALIAETRDQLSAMLADETRSLDDSKIAREDLAGLLSEVSLRLTKDFKLPKG
jgi:dsDNA-binding SOS-regulon protein